jgi:hypothetical protein
MAYDEGRDRIILWGGVQEGGGGLADPAVVREGQSNGTWTNVGASDPEGDGNPVGRRQFGMTYDPLRQRILVHGGCASTGIFVCSVNDVLSDTWEWNGSSFRQAQLTDPEGDSNPSAGEQTKIINANGRLRMIGNQAVLNAEGIIWEWEGSTRRYPAHRVEIPFVAASDTGATIEMVKIDIVGAGSSPGQNGAALRLWDKGGWDQKTSNTSLPGNVSALSWTSPDAASARRLFTDVTRSMHFAVTPHNPRGSGESEVEIDYFEVRIDYTEAP